MRFSKFKQQKNVRYVYDLNELEIYHPPNNKLINLVRDKRSFIGDDKLWRVYPIAFDNVQVFIVCPHCGNIHLHGIGSGHRVCHCKPPNEDNNGYWILDC